MSSERSLDGKTILVTGGAGFIGSHFIRMVLRRHPSARVVNLDKLTYAGNLDNLHDVQDDPRYEFILGDIRDKALVRRVFARVQGIVHFRRRNPRRPVDLRSRRVRPVQRPRHLHAPRRPPGLPGRRVLRPRLDRRGLRQPDRAAPPSTRPGSSSSSSPTGPGTTAAIPWTRGSSGPWAGSRRRRSRRGSSGRCAGTPRTGAGGGRSGRGRSDRAGSLRWAARAGCLGGACGRPRCPRAGPA